MISIQASILGTKCSSRQEIRHAVVFLLSMYSYIVYLTILESKYEYYQFITVLYTGFSSVAALNTCAQTINSFASANNMQLATLVSSPANTIQQWYGVTCAFAYSWSDNSSGSAIKSAVCLSVNGTTKWITAYSCIRTTLVYTVLHYIQNFELLYQNSKIFYEYLSKYK